MVQLYNITHERINVYSVYIYYDYYIIYLSFKQKQETALHLCCFNGHATVAEILLKQNCNADVQNTV